MPNEILHAVWKEIEGMLGHGLNLVPVFESGPKPKSPCGPWDKWKTEKITKGELWDWMARFNTSSVAIVCGKVSGNFEVLDIDSKHLPGCDSWLFAQINLLYPELFVKIRRHKSRSGGYHLLYYISDHEVPPGEKLAKRLSTDEELIVKPKEKTKCFFETRGEKQVIVAPPSVGYSVSWDVPIPTITWQERCALINIAKSFDQIIEPVKERRVVGDTPSNYDESPFDHFNRSDAGALALTDFGWTECQDNSKFTWYTRPGGRRGDTHASYNKDKKCFHIFTTSSELDSDKAYKPATIIRLLKFGGDGKKTFKYLVSEGFGRLNANREREIVKKASVNNTPPPPNLSKEALEEYSEKRKVSEGNYPHGTFWVYNEDSNLIIDREALYQVADGLGFRLWRDNPVRIDGKFIDNITEREFFDTIKAYVKEEDADFYREICNTYEAFIERHGKFTISRLPILAPGELLRDDRDVCYKAYSNGVISITGDGVEQIPYGDIKSLIWRKNVHNRDFTNSESGAYVEFLKLGANFAARREYILRCIGFLAHEYKDETTAYIPVVSEECENPKDGGGSGKNIFCKLFSQITTYTNKPGAQAKFDEKFFQSWNDERIFCLSDVPKNFDFLFLKEPSSGDGILKKLFKDERQIPNEEMPKFIIQTNYSYEIKDGGLKRRILPIEFTSHFTTCGGVDIYFAGKHFPKGWTTEDWAGFDTVMALGIQAWIKAGCKIEPPSLSQGGWMKQFTQTYGQIIHGLILDNWEYWLKTNRVKNDEFKAACTAYYLENSTPKPYEPSPRKINEALKEWAEHHNCIFLYDQQDRENGIKYKYRWFGKSEDPPF